MLLPVTAVLVVRALPSPASILILMLGVVGLTVSTVMNGSRRLLPLPLVVEIHSAEIVLLKLMVV